MTVKFTMLLTLIGFVSMGLQAQTDPAIDPTGTLAALQAVDNGCEAERDAIMAGIEVDQHPVHGTVLPADFPVRKGGWSYDYLGEDVVAGATKVEVASFEFTGTALVEHKIGDETVHVWHRYQNEPAVLILSQNENDPKAGPEVSARFWGCGNGWVLDWKFDWYLIGEILGRW